MTKRLAFLIRLVLKLLMACAVMAIGLSVAAPAQAAAPQLQAPAMVQTGGYNPTAATIAAAAEAQVGMGQDCTMLVTNALAAAGINFHDWPVGYTSLGYAVSPSQAIPGDLLYYANGGNGLDHVAVYAGNGMAVHGGFNGGSTVLFSVNTHSGSPDEYIRVTGGSVATPAPAPAPDPKPAPAMQTVADISPAGAYVVAPGESLSSIASATGIGDWHALLAANPQITNPNAVYAGQQLNLPTSAPAPATSSPAPQAGSQIHTVAPGETLSSIAAAHGLSDWHTLWNANSGISNPDVISVGQQLVLP